MMVISHLPSAAFFVSAEMPWPIIWIGRQEQQLPLLQDLAYVFSLAISWNAVQNKKKALNRNPKPDAEREGFEPSIPFRGMRP